MPFGNDDLTPEEQAQYDQFMSTDQTVPPPDVEEGAPASPPPTDAPPAAAPTPAPAPSAPPAPPADPAAPAAPAAPPAPEQTDDERFAAWQAQHAGKSPEELARLAFQQSQRANGAEARARTATQSVAQIQERVRLASERATALRNAADERDRTFNEQLANDPDGAARALHDRQLREDRARIDADELVERQSAAIDMASTALPDYFTTNANAVRAFGGEMGYSQAELDGIADGRDLVVLSLANMAATAIKAGLMDTRGQLIAAPQPVAAAPTDPRLNAPTPPQTLSSAPARPANSGGSAVTQATDILNMSDADFAKLPQAEIDALMKQLVG